MKRIELIFIPLSIFLYGCPLSDSGSSGDGNQPPTMPDFKVLDVIGPDQVYVGTSTDYTIRYINSGKSYSGSFDYWVNFNPPIGANFGIGRIFPISYSQSNGEILTLNFTFTPTAPTSYPFIQGFDVIVDPNNNIDESHESNNGIQFNVSVLATPPG